MIRNHMKRLDDIDKKIITMINEDWEQGITKIGRKLGLSHTAVRSRLKRLKRDLIKVNCNVDTEKLGLKLFLICLEARFKSRVVDHVKNCPKIINYFDTYGEHNFIIFAVAENIETMESMIEQCFSFNFTDITKYSVLPITNSQFTHQKINFYTPQDKKKMKCNFKTICSDCELYKEDRCVGCPLYPGYKGIL
jgi:DNA-binding Lrp family transcriptional regulator